jgi:DNA polymerase V
LMLTRYQDRSLYEDVSQSYAIPLYASRVSAGYPTQVEDYLDQMVYLSKSLIKHPSSTFLVIAKGNSMINAGIQSGDRLVVDKQLAATHGRVVLATIDGESTVKRLSLERNKACLLPENPDYKPIRITPDQHVILWGVVTFVLAKESLLLRDAGEGVE